MFPLLCRVCETNVSMRACVYVTCAAEGTIKQRTVDQMNLKIEQRKAEAEGESKSSIWNEYRKTC